MKWPRFAVTASMAAGLALVLQAEQGPAPPPGGAPGQGGAGARQGGGRAAGKYNVDANWARLPAGTTWNGNTSWITTDGKGQVMVLVRTAPYFRVLRPNISFSQTVSLSGSPR